MTRTEEILYHLITEYYKEYPNESIDETKLMKLLYLSDRKSMEDNNRRLTGINYANYTYGPYSEEVEEAVQRADKRHLFHEVEDRRSPKYGSRYEFCNCPEHKTEVRFKDSDGIITSVIKEYGSMSDKELVKFVKSLPEIRDKDKYVPINLDDVSNKNS